MKPSTTLVLRALQDAGDRGLTTGQLTHKTGTRFGARIQELRQAGYIVTEQRVKANQSLYTLARQDEEGPLILNYLPGGLCPYAGCHCKQKKGRA